jgi:hypothetical protein
MASLSASPSLSTPSGTAQAAPDSLDTYSCPGVTPRVVAVSLVLALIFGYCIPVVDYKMSNTFLGAAHLPAASVAVMLLVVLVLNPLLNFVTAREGRAPFLLGAAIGCVLLSEICRRYDVRIGDLIAPRYGILMWVLFFGGVGGIAGRIAGREKRVLFTGLGLLFASFLVHFLDKPEEWASVCVLLRWLFLAAALLLAGGFFLKRPLSRNESLTVYITCLFSALVPGRGSENFFIPNILASFYYSTRENKWLDFLQPHIKTWMTPALKADGTLNNEVLSGWYSGNGGQVPWQFWAVPLIAWCSLILAIHVMQGCLGVMLRAQWAQREALAFPLLRLPLTMTEHLEGDAREPNAVSFFRNPVMWIGFGIAVFIETMNGLNLYFPDVPQVSLSIPAGPLLSEPPWNQIGNLDLRIYPAIVGISYLLTSEVSFSLWFLYLMTKVQLIIAFYLGFPPNSLPTPFWTRGWAKGFIGYEQVGAFFAYAGILLWIGREHFAHIVKRAFGRATATPGERDEALSYPAAFWGFAGALSFAIGWTMLAGVSPLVAVLMWGFYLAIALCLTRLVAEGGLMFVHTGWMTLGPLAFLFGPKVIDAASAAPASIISGATMFELRGFLLPSFVQSFKLAHDRKIAVRPLLILIAAVTVISFWLSVYTIVNMGYTTGGLQMQRWWVQAGAQQPAQHTIGIARDIANENLLANWLWVGSGGLMTCLIMLGRSRLPWFPLHPIGLLMCVPFAMFTMWVSIMLGWLAKTLITKFGGTDSYRKTVPAFLGLALGDIVMVVFWVVIDAWQGRTGHSLLPF